MPSDMLVARAHRTIEEITGALLASAAGERSDTSLARGAAGLAVAFAHLGRAGRDDCDDACTRCLRSAVRGLEHSRLDPSLFVGFTGIAWAVAHIGALDGEPAAPLLEEIDEALVTWLRPAPGSCHFDLISGLSGIGLYALERLPDAIGRQLLETVVTRLAERAERRQGAACWWTPPSLMAPELRPRFPNGRLDLGMAHGAAGVVALLGGAESVGVRGAHDLLADAVHGLLEHADDAPGPRFPYWVSPDDDPGPARLAWCYGDLGIAAALVGAARAAGVPEWERTGIEIAREASARDLHDSGVVEAGLCHGAGGVAHLFSRLAAATGDVRLQEAADRWLEHTLSFRRPGAGVAGYLASGNSRSTWRADRGLLNGAAGIALALLAATTDAEPGWDRLFLPATPHAALAAPTSTRARGQLA